MFLFNRFFLPVLNTTHLLGGGRFWNPFLLYGGQVLCLFFLPLLFQIPPVVWVSLCGLLLCLCTVPVLLFSLQDAGFLCRAAKNRFSLPIFCWLEQFTRARSECKGVVLFSSWLPVLSGGWAPFERQPCASLWNKNMFERQQKPYMQDKLQLRNGIEWAGVFSIYAWEHSTKWCLRSGIRLKGLSAKSPLAAAFMQSRGILLRLIQGLLKRETQDTHRETRTVSPAVTSEPEACQCPQCGSGTCLLPNSGCANDNDDYGFDERVFALWRHTDGSSSVCCWDSDATVQRCITLLMLGSGLPSGGLLKMTGFSSSVDGGGGCRVGLGGLQDVVADNGAGCNFTSGFLDAGSRADGERARLACRGESEVLRPGENICLVHSLFYILNMKTIKLKMVFRSPIL